MIINTHIRHHRFDLNDGFGNNKCSGDGYGNGDGDGDC